jgi:hypothetical protein
MLYPKRPEPYHERLNDIIHSLFADQGANLSSFSSLLECIVKEHPEFITSAHVDYLFESLKSSTDAAHSTSYLYQTLGYVANAQPRLFDQHRDDMLHPIIKQHNYNACKCFHQYCVASVILGGEITANEYLNLLIDLIKNNGSMPNDLKTQIFLICQVIGARHTQSLADKRDALLPFESNVACRMLIDIIDGNKLSEESQAAITRTLDDIAQIEQRVTHTEISVQNVTKLVKRQELHVRCSVSSSSRVFVHLTEKTSIHPDH